MTLKSFLGINRISCLSVLLSTLLPLVFARAAPLDTALVAPTQLATGWVNVTNNVGGQKWGAYGVTYMKAVPGSNTVIAGVSECGLWATSDSGPSGRSLVAMKSNSVRAGLFSTRKTGLCSG
ncbi:MAG: hypothetical protein JO316_06510 [Abitibacteriaceae bacterium]|nr:hypothetical protein [Abditibacteriaceae bacterium]